MHTWRIDLTFQPLRLPARPSQYVCRLARYLPGQVAPNNWQAQMGAKLMKALCMALYWQEQLDSGAVESMAAIAKREGMEKMRVYKIMKLARLAPHYVEAIARGQGPIGLSFEFFVRKILPHDWGQQEVVIDALAG